MGASSPMCDLLVVRCSNRGGGQKKVGLAEKTFSSHVTRITHNHSVPTTYRAFGTCWHSSVGLFRVIAHVQHAICDMLAVSGPFSIAWLAAQWHEPAINVHCRNGWYLCLRAQRPPSTPSYASCCSTPSRPLVGGKSPHAQCIGRDPGQATGGPRTGTITRHGRSGGAPSLLWSPRR